MRVKKNSKVHRIYGATSTPKAEMRAQKRAFPSSGLRSRELYREGIALTARRWKTHRGTSLVRLARNLLSGVPGGVIHREV